MEKQYITYELWNPITNEPFYVGAGTEDRPIAHLYEASNQNIHSYKVHIIRNLQKHNLKPIIKIVFIGSREEAFNREVELIKKYGRADLNLGPLANLTNGGDGGTPGIILSEKTRRNMSNSRIGKNNPMYGRKHSIKSRKLIKKNHIKCDGMNNANAKKWKLVFPSGEVLLIDGNIMPTCKKLKIDYSCLLRTTKTGKSLSKGNGAGCILYDLGRDKDSLC